MEFAIILILILSNGLFAMSEIAIVAASKSKLSTEAKKGNKRSLKALKLAKNPDKFFSTVQIGITLIGILTGIYSGDALGESFAKILDKTPIPTEYSLFVAKAIIVIGATYLTLIFGELVPKRIGLAYPEKIARIAAKPMSILSKTMSPFVYLLSKSSSVVCKILGVSSAQNKVTEEEIKMMIEEGTENGEVQKIERNILNRVFSLGDRFVSSIMTPRNEIIRIEADATSSEIKKIVAKFPHTIYPVANGSLDEISGIVSLEDLFLKIDSPDFKFKDNTRQALYFHEDTKVYNALEELRTKRQSYAIVCNEFGVTLGIITLNDIIDAILGNMPELGEEAEIIERDDNSYLIDGQYSFYDFSIFFNLDEKPNEQYNTLGGLILSTLGKIPKAGEKVKWKNFVFEIMDMDGARIDKILAKKICIDPQEQADTDL